MNLQYINPSMDKAMYDEILHLANIYRTQIGNRADRLIESIETIIMKQPTTGAEDIKTLRNIISLLSFFTTLVQTVAKKFTASSGQLVGLKGLLLNNIFIHKADNRYMLQVTQEFHPTVSGKDFILQWDIPVMFGNYSIDRLAVILLNRWGVNCDPITPTKIDNSLCGAFKDIINYIK